MDNKKQPNRTEGSSDQSIGRPKEWREGRYQCAGKPVDQGVATPGNKDQGPSIISTPVTREDYEAPPAQPTNPKL
jgi:hypothetical protein